MEAKETPAVMGEMPAGIGTSVQSVPFTVTSSRVVALVQPSSS